MDVKKARIVKTFLCAEAKLSWQSVLAISHALIGRELLSIRVRIQTLQNDLILAQFPFLFLTEKLSILLKKKKNKQTNKKTNRRQFSIVYSRS